MEAVSIFLLLLAGFASQGGRATVTYQPTSLKGDGQGCPSHENKAQVIEQFHSLIEERVETEITPETRILTEINTAVETLSQEVAELSNNSQTVNETLTELSQELAELSNNSQTVNETLTELSQELAELSNSSQTVNETLTELSQAVAEISNDVERVSQSVDAHSDFQDTIILLPSTLLSQGWTRVAYLDVTNSSHQCPAGWETYTTPKRTCGRNSTIIGCQSVFYPTNGVSYSRGVTAYQDCSTDAFFPYNQFPTRTVDDVYLDGISITHGSNPREHVWSFVAAYDETYDGPDNFSCPCTNTNNNNNPNILIPPFVGDDYFCDTGTVTNSVACIFAPFFSDDPLWDGEGCGPTNTCCELNNAPWFCKTLPVSQPVTDDIELRICGNEDIVFEDTPVELIELYVY